jgi:hypothetical protein
LSQVEYSTWSARLELLRDLLERAARSRQLADARADGLQELAERPDQAGIADRAVPGNDGVRRPGLELGEDVDPAAPVGVGVGQDREETVLDEVAGEEDALVGQHDDLVSSRVRRTDVPEVHPRAAEVDLGLAAVGDVGPDELDVGEDVGDLGREA